MTSPHFEQAYKTLMGKNNVLLAAAVALLSYFPFDVIAKLTLIVAALMFILNPFPLARIIALICILVLAILNKVKKSWDLGQETAESDVEEIEDMDAKHEKRHVD